MNQHDEGGAAHSVWRRRLLGADPLRQLRMRQQLTAFAAMLVSSGVFALASTLGCRRLDPGSCCGWPIHWG
jgi:hypothetical protein